MSWFLIILASLVSSGTPDQIQIVKERPGVEPVYISLFSPINSRSGWTATIRTQGQTREIKEHCEALAGLTSSIAFYEPAPFFVRYQTVIETPPRIPIADGPEYTIEGLSMVGGEVTNMMIKFSGGPLAESVDQFLAGSVNCT